jgi:succinate dehydrogenase/fumarate reductase flavoprotein subunit
MWQNQGADHQFAARNIERKHQMNWHEYVNETGKVPEWPYPVNYGKENTVEADVLVVGGGGAGLRAAIAAKQRGAKVVIADRGFTKRSGAGGAGVDHWHGAVKNPCSKITPKMYSEAAMDTTDGYTSGLARFVIGNEGWDTLLELEKMGMQIRDEDDEFKGSIFRDDETKLLFAYDLENKHCLRIYGADIKPITDKEARTLGCEIYERVCITALLTENGKRGGRVIGATGVHDRTGEFYVFKAKSVVIGTGRTQRLWCFAPELIESQTMSNLNQAGLGHTIGWRAGAEFILMEWASPARLPGTGYAPYSMGNSNNTYQGVAVIDRNGKAVQYANAYGDLIDTEEGIYEPPKDGSFVIGWGIALDHEQKPEYRLTLMDPNIWDKIRSGEYEQPFYTDMTQMRETSRDVIWRLMLAHEGKCRVPIYEQFSAWGFDPAKHMLQYPVGDYTDHIQFDCPWIGPQSAPPNWRVGGGGYLIDWRLQTSLPGLFVCGDGPIASQGCHGESHTAGRYAGRQAFVFAEGHPVVEPDAGQLANEKARVYGPITAQGDIGWKEFNYAVARIMQDYCGEYKTEHTLDMGIRRMRDLLETEGERMYASNPHELARVAESLSLADLGIAYMEGAKARQASNHVLGFTRADYPDDTPEWHKFIAICLADGKEDAVRRDVPVDYHLRAPYSSDLEENYQKYGEFDR